MLCCPAGLYRSTLSIAHRKPEEGWTSAKGADRMRPMRGAVGTNMKGTLTISSRSCLLRGPGLETQLEKVVIIIKNNAKGSQNYRQVNY